MNIGIADEDLSQILNVFKSNSKINDLILFGSRAIGNYNIGSDIDLCIKGNQLVLDDVLELKIGLDKLALPYQFDIIIFDRIQEKELIGHIERVGVMLY